MNEVKQPQLPGNDGRRYHNPDVDDFVVATAVEGSDPQVVYQAIAVRIRGEPRAEFVLIFWLKENHRPHAVAFNKLMTLRDEDVCPEEVKALAEAFGINPNQKAAAVQQALLEAMEPREVVHKIQRG